MAGIGTVVGLINALGKPSPEVIESAVSDWLDDHPEATTTVEDGSITKAKLDSSLQGTVDDVSDLKNEITLLIEEKSVQSGNIVDARGKTASANGYLDDSIHFTMGNGTYYSNPFLTDTNKPINLYPTDSNGETIYMTRSNGDRVTYLELHNSYLWKVTVNGLNVNIKGYSSQSNYESDTATFNRDYTIDEAPAYWRFKGSGYGNGGTVDRGITIDEYSTSFVQYTGPITEYEYASDLDEHIEEFTDEIEETLGSEIESIESYVADVPELAKKSAEVLHVYSGNVVDTTGKTAPGSTLDSSITFTFENDIYFSNPFTTDTGKKIVLYPKDKDGNAVYLTKTGGTRVNNFELYATFLWKVVVDELNFSLYAFQTVSQYNSNTYNTSYSIKGVFDSKPAYFVFGGTGYTEGGSIDRGFTQGEYKTSYVEYASPTKTYVYTKELNNHISGYTETLHNDLLKPSENLLDYGKINWNLESGYYYLEEGYYMPVSEGDVVETNIESGAYEFYDSSYALISGSYGFANVYVPITVPENAIWMRVHYQNGFISEGDPAMIWKARSETSAPYERPIYRPNLKYNAKYADSDIFDYAVPSSLTQGIMRMARFAALRVTNERQSAFRFATFNTYVSRSDSGFSQIREMALDYALDFIGCQECYYPGTKLQSAMYQFQFPYGSQAVLDQSNNNIPVPVVSRFEITAVEDIALQESRHCLKVTMNIPQNKHYPRVPTLSVYNYHGSLSRANRLIEIQTMLDEIAEDTSDFIIIMGDTNSEVDQQGHRQSWDMWENAGFTAVHHGESPTFPNPDSSTRSSMDNIFVSSHINVLGYDIIRSTNYPVGNNLPLSDHDLVFADLQFDFDAVLKDTWEEPRTVT